MDKKENHLMKNMLFCFSAAAYILLAVPASPKWLVVGTVLIAAIYLITRFIPSIRDYLSRNHNRTCLIAAVVLSLMLGLRFEKVWRNSQQLSYIAERVGVSTAWLLYPVGIVLGLLGIFFCYAVMAFLFSVPKKLFLKAGAEKPEKTTLTPNKLFLLGVAAILLVQTVVLVYWGVKKQGFHVDEVYTFELSNYRYTNYGDASDAYDTWITGDDLKTVVEPDGTELFNFTVPYWNSETDNHPFIYYSLVHFFSSVFCLLHLGVQKWAALIPNVAACVGTSIVLSMLAYALTKNRWAAIMASAFWILSIGGISTGVFLRMYALLTFWCVLFTYLHALFYQRMKQGKPDIRLGKLMMLCTTVGILTQYYFLIFAFFFCAITFAVLCFRREWKLLMAYTVMELNGVLLAELLFPRMLFRLLFGDRGQEALSNAVSANLSDKLAQILKVFNEELFGGYGAWVFGFSAGLFVLGIVIHVIRREKMQLQIRFLLQIMLTVSLFILVITKLAPYMTDRYFMCIFPLLLLSCVGCLYMGILLILQNSRVAEVMACIAVTLLVGGVSAAGFATQQVRYVYTDRTERVEALEAYGDVPVVTVNADTYDDSTLTWLFELENYSELFLCSHDNIAVVQQAAEERALSDGFLLYIHMYKDPEAVLKQLQEAIDFTAAELVTDGEGCPVYYVR